MICLGIETAKSVAGFVVLHQEMKKMLRHQERILAITDPIQSKINAFIRDKVHSLFKQTSKGDDQFEQLTTLGLISIIMITSLVKVMPNFLHTPLAVCALFFSIFGTHKVLISADQWVRDMYQLAKVHCFSHFFLTTQSIINTAEYVEKTTSVVISILDRFSDQNRLSRSAGIGIMTTAVAVKLSLITSDMSTILIFSGVFLIILKNGSTFSLCIKDCQKLAQNSTTLFKTYDGIEEKIEIARKSLINALYFNCVIRYITERVYGTREKAQRCSSELIKNKIFSKIDNYKKRVCFYVASQITDNITEIMLEMITVQAFRMSVANFTGIGLTAGVYWTSYFALLPLDEQCHWSTPLEYTHNRIFPLYLVQQFPEECAFYESVATTVCLMKWGALLIIWERMVRSWGKKRETAIQDLLQSLKVWGRKQLGEARNWYIELATRIGRISSRVLNRVIRRS